MAATTSDPQGPHTALATSQIVTLPPIPELFDPNFLDVLVPPTDQNAPSDKVETADVPSNPMMDALRSTAHQKLTANCAPTFSSTLVSTLDAYLGLRTGISGASVDSYLENSWIEDPNLTLRIIWSIRSIHDGKGEKELFYRAFGWLFEKHPRTAITNLHNLVEPLCLRSGKGADQGMPHGYWKDLLNILALATVDELKPRRPLHPRSNFLHNYYIRNSRPVFANNQEQEEWSRARRIERSRNAYDRLTQKLHDNRYRALYVAVARLFAGQLAKESVILNKISALPVNADKADRMSLLRSLTLSLKWAPTPGGSHDRITNISSAICLLLHEAQATIAQRFPFTHTSSLPVQGMHLLRCAYQKRILTRGRSCIGAPEPLMSSNRWSEIIYSRVPSICMSNNKEKFFVHDEERFFDYLNQVESGKKKISGATLFPHVLAMEATKVYRLQNSRGKSSLSGLRRKLGEAQQRVVDAQWNTLLNRLRESGQLDNCIAVCDVSGSMGGISLPIKKVKSAFDVLPIWPAISLSLLVARLAKPPFNDSFITFSERPAFVALEPESKTVSLGATLEKMDRAEWGANTDFNAVFLKLILPLAIKHNVSKDDMIKRIFVFSDMQFDSANTMKHTHTDSAAEWKTNHDHITEAYAKAGYDVPELVYWDLSRPQDGHGITAPVTAERQGVALLSGYSPSLLKVFMGNEEESWEVLDEEDHSRSRSEQPIGLTPEELMKRALGKRSYDGLVVVD